jgi:hypothetical protein
VTHLTWDGRERVTASIRSDRLRALYGVFSTHSITGNAPRGALREESFRAATDAAAALIGAERATDLGSALRRDLEGGGRIDPKRFRDDVDAFVDQDPEPRA